jgi:hypothetical protein
MIERGALTSLRGRELRSWLLMVAAVVVVVICWQLTMWGVVDRVAVALFPGGTPVPLTVVRDGGPVASGTPPLIASTSMEVIRHGIADPYCAVPPPPPGLHAGAVRCWRDVQTPPNTLLIATVSPFCGNYYERVAILRGDTLVIRVIDRCPDPPIGDRALAQPANALLGVPADHLPKGKIAVQLDDDRAERTTVSVTLP